jgi:ATP adenylyltransferase
MTNQPRNLEAPWRDAYLRSMSEESAAARGGSTGKKADHCAPARSPSGSFLRDYWLCPEQDERNHVIVRTGNASGNLEDPEGLGGMILLNLYPYAGGHLLVALGEPRARLLDYSKQQRSALWELVEIASDLMERTLRPQGINYGVNEGRAAGAGVPQHLHAHLVPRWHGDVNFITTVADARVIPVSVDATAERYRDVWKAMRG